MYEETLTTAHRLAYIQQHGFARTLQEMLNQEGYAMAIAGCTQPHLDTDNIAYTSEIVEPHLSTQNHTPSQDLASVRDRRRF